jgi:hypothetical protein
MDHDQEPERVDVAYSLNREGGLAFHYRQGLAWLQASETGAYSTPLAYAAFEFRLAIERVAFEFLVRVQGLEETKKELLKLRSFKSVERRIRQLAGHQREIDRAIEFINIVMREAGAKFTTAKVDVGRLSNYWHECSEFCHIFFTLASAAGNKDFAATAYEKLAEVEGFLGPLCNSVVSWWGKPEEPSFQELQAGFISGLIDEAKVTAKLRETGVWGLYTAPDGSKTLLQDLEPVSRRE